MAVHSQWTTQAPAYTTGVICTYTKVGLPTGINIKYQFVAQDIKGGNATPTPEKDAPDVNPPPTTVVINEADTGTSDAVELYNPGSQAVNLSGWHLIAYNSSNTVDVDYNLPSGFTLNPGAYVVIHETTGTNTVTDLYIGGSITWSNAAATGAVALTNGTNGIDFVRFGTSAISPPTGTSWSGTNPLGHPNRHTLGRSPTSTDTDTGSDWCSEFPPWGLKMPTAV